MEVRRNCLFRMYPWRRISSSSPAALDEALDLQKQGTLPDSRTLARLLLACGRSKALEEGRRIHAHVYGRGLGTDSFLCTHLVHMYLKCGSYDEAELIFRTMSPENVDVSTHTAVVVARASLGKWGLVFEQLEHMKQNKIPPDRVMFVALLTACTKLNALSEGRKIHEQHLMSTNLETDLGILNVTLNMYSKSGRLEEAMHTFERILNPDVISWTMIIGAHAQQGNFAKSFHLFQRMQLEGTRPNQVTFVSVLSACETMDSGRCIHRIVSESGLSNIFVENSLLGMYSRCRRVQHARTLFESMQVRDIVSWTTIITAFSQQDGCCSEAVLCYRRMLQEGVMPKSLTFCMVLEACGSLSDIKSGTDLHKHVLERGMEVDVVAISLVNMYAKCSKLEDARQVFDRIHHRSRILWNSMITAYQEKDPHEAINLFRQMQTEAVEPDRITFTSILNVCTKLLDPETGRMVHERILASGYLSDVCVSTALLNMHARCGSLEDARNVFESMGVRDTVSWNNIISAYVQNKHGGAAIELLWRMQQDGMRPNKSTFASLVNACSAPEYLSVGKRIHSWIVESGLSEDIVIQTGLVTMYANCGGLEDARDIFDRVFSTSSSHHCDLILWTSMITAYEQHGEFHKALDLYEQMHARGVEPDRVTFIAVLNACSHITDLKRGRIIHSRVIRAGLFTDGAVANSVVFMYAKCGSFDEAGVAFDKVVDKSVALWSSMISAYAQNGHGEQAVQLFRRMRQDGIELNYVTFIAVLSACSHVGLVEEGCEFFGSMFEHGIEASLEHYGCMVDLLARAGHLQTAEDVINKMPLKVNRVVLTTFLAACKVHGDVERGRRVAEKLEMLDPDGDSAYVTLFNIELQSG